MVHYTPQSVPPQVRVTSLRADQEYASPTPLTLPTTAGRLRLRFFGTSPVDAPADLLYRYRLEGYDSEWHLTRAGEVEYPPLAPGVYTFGIQAVDRDLNASSVACVELTVTEDPRTTALHETLRGRVAPGKLIGESAPWRAVLAAREGVIRPEHLDISEEDAALLPLEEYVRRYRLRVLAQTRGVISGEGGAAARLGIHPNTLRHRLHKLGIPFRQKDRAQ